MKYLMNLNNKKYIGKTEESIEKRFNEHCREAFRERSLGRPLYRAMRKYGLEHFSIKLIEKTTEPEVSEIYWILQSVQMVSENLDMDLSGYLWINYAWGA